MTSSNLIRLGGLVTVLAGVLIIVLTTIRFVDPIDPTNIAEESTTWNYAWLNWLWVLDFVLLQIGLVTLYADRAEALGVIDLVSFVLFSRRAHLGPASGPRT